MFPRGLVCLRSYTELFRLLFSRALEVVSELCVDRFSRWFELLIGEITLSTHWFHGPSGARIGGGTVWRGGEGRPSLILSTIGMRFLTWGVLWVAQSQRAPGSLHL